MALAEYDATAIVLTVRGSSSAGLVAVRLKLASGNHMNRVAPTATTWQRRRSDGSEKEGAWYQAQHR
jgi:hypothetical protein